MEWEARQWHIRAAIVAGSEHDAKYIGCFFGIIAKSFIKVTNAIKQDGIGVFGLQLKILRHERRLFGIAFLSHRLVLWPQSYGFYPGFAIVMELLSPDFASFLNFPERLGDLKMGGDLQNLQKRRAKGEGGIKSLHIIKTNM